MLGEVEAVDSVWSSTRRPATAFAIIRMITLTTSVQATVMVTDASCTMNCEPAVTPSARPMPPNPGSARNATRSDPMMPPTPCTAKTSSESSIFSLPRMMSTAM